MNIRTVDIFCGVGGLSLGFKKAGYKIVGSFDSWDRAINLYKDNFKHPAAVMDLSVPDRVIPKLKELNPDVIVGGPPCQDFSHAGDRNEGERANLTLSFAKIVSAISPKVFVMENVDRAQKSKAYQSARAELMSNGYGLTEIVLDASFCRVPQKRKRFFCIGVMGGKNFFFDSALRDSMSRQAMTLRDYMGGGNRFRALLSSPPKLQPSGSLFNRRASSYNARSQ